MSGPTFDNRSGTAALAALLLVQICVGYEWLVSGLTKAAHGDFAQGLAGELRDMSGNAPAWYRGFLTGAVIPHAQAFAYVIEAAELVVGVLLLGAGIALLVRGSAVSARMYRALFLATAAASLFGLLLVVNFALANGSSFGLSLAQDSFDEGVDLDALLIGLQLALFLFGLAGLARRGRQVPISNSRNTSFRLVLRSVCGLRQPTTSAQATSYVPAGNAFGRVPGTTTARGGT